MTVGSTERNRNTKYKRYPDRQGKEMYHLVSGKNMLTPEASNTTASLQTSLDGISKQIQALKADLKIL